MGASFAAVYYLISTTVESAFQIVEKLQSGNAVLDMEAISELVAKQSIGAENHLINIASAVFVICWLIGIVDSYRAGWLQDKEP